ncbi:MAG: KEOPS complex subunit Cgi121 [Archaeoglobaceae archaeon]|nr:KEOPS complex subunit Cgi121 [Archaeoglobaceae archaeon]MDW8127728.1 KEOPS complex subunit Cgi121 [Archaeoglobaceae archaeon]
MRILFGTLKKPTFGDFACFIDSKYVVDLSTVDFAVKKAIKNWNSGKRISRSLAIEILLYYSANRQIETAKKLTGTKKVVAIILDENEFSEIDFNEEEFYPEFDLELVREHYEISDEEIRIVGVEKLPLLIKERIALFSSFGE